MKKVHLFELTVRRTGTTWWWRPAQWEIPEGNMVQKIGNLHILRFWHRSFAWCSHRHHPPQSDSPYRPWLERMWSQRTRSVAPERICTRSSGSYQNSTRCALNTASKTIQNEAKISLFNATSVQQNNKSIANYIFSVGGTLSIALSLAVANHGGHCQQQDQLLHHTSMSLSYFSFLALNNNNTVKICSDLRSRLLLDDCKPSDRDATSLSPLWVGNNSPSSSVTSRGDRGESSWVRVLRVLFLFLFSIQWSWWRWPAMRHRRRDIVICCVWGLVLGAWSDELLSFWFLLCPFLIVALCSSSDLHSMGKRGLIGQLI